MSSRIFNSLMLDMSENERNLHVRKDFSMKREPKLESQSYIYIWSKDDKEGR